MKSLLLSCGDDEQITAYYREVLNTIRANAVGVQLDIEGKGKGLVATRQIPEGETVFTERPLVSLQHIDNKGSALVCQQCLQFIGSVERQIGHKLQCLMGNLRSAQRGEGSQGDGGDDDGEDVDLDAALEAGERLEQIYSHVTPEQIADLRSGATTLPLSDDFQLPAQVPCRRGCGALYCCAACEQEAWDQHHCLLCTAGATGTPAAVADTSAAVADAGATTSSSSAPGGASSAAASGSGSGAQEEGEGGEKEELYGIRVDRRAVAAFVEHARGTNEIFLLAAQVVAATLLRAARLLQAGGKADTPVDAAGAGAAGSVASPAESVTGEQVREAGDEAAGPSSSQAAAAEAGGGCGGDEEDAYRAALLAAWRPYMYGWKRCWWESVAVPDDVEHEEEFRGQLRELASDSLELLSAAITDPRFTPELMQLEVYGSIVGMFELNNLGLTVASPVEDFFLAVDDLEEGEDKRAVTQVTQPLLDALDTEYAAPCEATAFLAVQSCINHSCDPNCTAACDTGDRTVTVLAQRDIAPGEEITLSYIDVSLPYKERQVELRDYGFVCRCARCTTEAAAARAKRQGGAAKGVKVGGGSRRR